MKAEDICMGYHSRGGSGTTVRAVGQCGRRGRCRVVSMHTMNACERVEILLHSFLSSTLDGGEC